MNWRENAREIRKKFFGDVMWFRDEEEQADVNIESYFATALQSADESGYARGRELRVGQDKATRGLIAEVKELEAKIQVLQKECYAAEQILGPDADFKAHLMEHRYNYRLARAARMNLEATTAKGDV